MGRDGWEREGRLRVEVAVLGTREQVRDAGVLQERGGAGRDRPSVRSGKEPPVPGMWHPSTCGQELHQWSSLVSPDPPVTDLEWK